MTILVRPIKPSFYFKNKIIRNIIKPSDTIWKKKNNNGSEIIKLKNSFDIRFDEFERMHSKGKILIQTRCSAYLDWRYHQNPSRKYETLVYCDSEDAIKGYTVVRITEINGIRLAFILEFNAITLVTATGLFYKASEYLWDQNVSFLIAASFPGNDEFNNLRALRFFKCPNRFRPHPFLLCLKVFDTNLLHSNTLSDTGSWFFSIGDNDAI